MLSRYLSGLKRWSGEFRKIWLNSKFVGIEKWTRRGLYFLRILSLSEHLSFFIVGAKFSRAQYRRDSWITDFYVVGKTILVALLIFLPDCWLSVWLATYLLAELYVVLLNVVILGTLPDERPISIPRSLLLLILNAFQI